MSVITILKTAGVAILFGFLAVNIIFSLVTFAQTGDWKPLADSTIGVVVSSDNNAFESMHELVYGDTNIPDSSVYKGFLMERVVINIIITIVMLFLFYKGIAFLMGGAIMDPTTKMVAVLLAVLLYTFLSASYILLIAFAQQGSDFTFTKETAIKLIPLKGLGYTVYSLVAHFNEIFTAENAGLVSPDFLPVNQTVAST